MIMLLLAVSLLGCVAAALMCILAVNVFALHLKSKSCPMPTDSEIKAYTAQVIYRAFGIKKSLP